MNRKNLRKGIRENKHFGLKWDQKTGRFVIPSMGYTGEKGKGLNAGRLQGPQDKLVHKVNKNFTTEAIEKMIDQVVGGTPVETIVEDDEDAELGVDDASGTITYKKGGPDKFSDNVDEWVYGKSLDGFGETTGDVSEMGEVYTLVTFDKTYTVKDNGEESWKFNSAIVGENDQGFVDVEYFEDEAEARKEFERVEKELAAAYPGEEDEGSEEFGESVTEAKGMEKVDGVDVTVYDNGGKTADQYSVVFHGPEFDEVEPGYKQMLNMSDNPTHPQGVSMWGSGEEGEHLGKRIKFSDLPPKVQQHVKDRLKNQ